MQELDDHALLREYVERDSEEAFAALVTRHINKVYSVALRHTRDPHHAEAITQTVFVTLARKARQLKLGVILSGWLYQTARLTSVTHIRGEIRRARREQEAYMQTATDQSESDAWTQIAPQLDAAMATLNETDRHAVVLRFFDGKSLKEVGTALGATEDASKKRVSRAVEKLRQFFTKRGVVLSTAALTAAITAHSVQAAPVTLAKTVTAMALTKSAAATIPTLSLAKATLLFMKTKAIVITASIVAVVALTVGTGAYLATHRKVHRVAMPRAAMPIELDNTNCVISGDRDGSFEVGFDPDTRRTASSAPAIHIKGPRMGAGKKTSDNSTTFTCTINAGSSLMGKRLRVTAWIKTRDVQYSSKAWLSIWTTNRVLYAFDTMDNRPIRGTTDWQQIEMVTQTPDEPCVIYFGPYVTGPGELWADDFQMDIVSPLTPITDDRAWRQTTDDTNTYSEKLDNATLHDGRPTVCLSSAPDDTVHGWTWWGQKLRGPFMEKYKGHSIRMTGWVKTENVSGHLEPSLRAWVAGTGYTKDSMANDHSLTGTRDWAEFTVTTPVSKKASHIDTAFIFWGTGKVWIDMDSVKCEVVK